MTFDNDMLCIDGPLKSVFVREFWLISTSTQNSSSWYGETDLKLISLTPSLKKANGISQSDGIRVEGIPRRRENVRSRRPNVFAEAARGDRQASRRNRGIGRSQDEKTQRQQRISIEKYGRGRGTGQGTRLERVKGRLDGTRARFVMWEFVGGWG